MLISQLPPPQPLTLTYYQSTTELPKKSPALVPYLPQGSKASPKPNRTRFGQQLQPSHYQKEIVTSAVVNDIICVYNSGLARERVSSQKLQLIVLSSQKLSVSPIEICLKYKLWHTRTPYQIRHFFNF